MLIRILKIKYFINFLVIHIYTLLQLIVSKNLGLRMFLFHITLTLFYTILAVI